MIYGIGSDIFEISRLKVAIEKDEGLIVSLFTENEIAYCEKMSSREQNYAARFSAKEAFMKALGTGWRYGISFSNIGIDNDESGKPFIQLTGKAEELANAEGISNIHVSLSHTDKLSTAFVILEKDI